MTKKDDVERPKKDKSSQLKTFDDKEIKDDVEGPKQRQKEATEDIR